MQRYGALVHQLGGLFSTGPDVGTTPADMDIIAETGAPYIFARTPAAGGSGEPGPYTALGVFAGIEVVCEHLFGEASVKDRRVLVQGAGDVGRNLIRYLSEAGAEVTLSEIDEQVASSFRSELGLEVVAPEAVYSAECDIFAPCALGGVLSVETIPQLNCRAVAGGANNQLGSRDDAERLRARGLLYAPDYVINVGGAMAVMGIEIQGWSREQAEQEVVQSVQGTLRRIFETAEAGDITTEVAARQIGEQRLSEGTSE